MATPTPWATFTNSNYPDRRLSVWEAPDADAVASAAARRIVAEIENSFVAGDSELVTRSGDGYVRVSLTGGTVGIAVLTHLARLVTGGEIPAHVAAALVTKTHYFFGDDRDADVSDPDSNEGAARRELLGPIGVPEENIHGYQLGKLPLDEAVSAYTECLARYASAGFDITVLGVGGEGHINSLFPHTDAVQESAAWVTSVTDSPKPPARRATLTLPAVASSSLVIVVAAGAGKAEAMQRLCLGNERPVELPVSGVFAADRAALYADREALHQIRR